MLILLPGAKALAHARAPRFDGVVALVAASVACRRRTRLRGRRC